MRVSNRRSRCSASLPQQAPREFYRTATPSWRAGSFDPLLLQLSSDVFDRENGTGALKRTLAVMLVHDVGDVPGAMLEIGARGSEELGDRLVDVLARAQDLASASPRRRESRRTNTDA